MQGAMTHLFAGVPVSDLDAGLDWYTRFFGRPPDLRAGDEILWDVDEHATLFIEPDAAAAGSGRITFAVVGLDALLERRPPREGPRPRRERARVRRAARRVMTARPSALRLPARSPS